jgi:hypothetical protein
MGRLDFLLKKIYEVIYLYDCKRLQFPKLHKAVSPELLVLPKLSRNEA